MPVLKYRQQRQKHVTPFANRIAAQLERGSTDATSGDVGMATLALSKLAVSKKARKAVRQHLKALRSTKAIRPRSDRSKSSLADLLLESDWISASQPFVLDEIEARDGTVYPLRQEITVVVKEVVNSANAFIQELKWLEPLCGRGPTADKAVEAFGESFHALVKHHHRKPSHMLTNDDAVVKRVLDHLIDWRQYEAMNPVEQPLWGRKGKRDKQGDLLVHWIVGPSDENDKEGTIHADDVCPELDELQEHAWFFGSGKVFQDHIEWMSLPVEVPDPHDEEASRAAWDLIPPHVMSDAGAWPLRRGD